MAAVAFAPKCTQNYKKGAKSRCSLNGINFSSAIEVLLTILSSLAQDESRKTSIRVKSGQQTSMENGVYYGNGNILGYNRVGKELVIDPEQAKTVRKIYDWYLDGMGVRQIQFELEKEGVLTAMGKTRWYESNISKILKNPFYAGMLSL